MSSKPTLRRYFKAQRHLGEAATRSIQDAAVSYTHLTLPTTPYV